VDDFSVWKTETTGLSEYFISSISLHVYTSRKTVFLHRWENLQ
jgi:hypothetical protein